MHWTGAEPAEYFSAFKRPAYRQYQRQTRVFWPFELPLVDHGRVGQRELLLAKARADLHYYVTTWPEIDCIAVRESAMVGTVPLTPASGVFGEKEYCVRVKGDPREAALPQALCHANIMRSATG